MDIDRNEITRKVFHEMAEKIEQESLSARVVMLEKEVSNLKGQRKKRKLHSVIKKLFKDIRTQKAQFPEFKYSDSEFKILNLLLSKSTVHINTIKAETGLKDIISAMKTLRKKFIKYGCSYINIIPCNDIRLKNTYRVDLHIRSHLE